MTQSIYHCNVITVYPSPVVDSPIQSNRKTVYRIHPAIVSSFCPHFIRVPVKHANSYLNATASLLLQENVFRLHITMDDFVFIKGVQAQEEAVSKLANQLQTEAHEFVFLYKLVEVYREELEGDTRMGAEGEVVEHMNDVHSVVFVLFPEVFEDSDLLLGLPVEPLFISDDFEGHM